MKADTTGVNKYSISYISCFVGTYLVSFFYHIKNWFVYLEIVMTYISFLLWDLVAEKDIFII